MSTAAASIEATATVNLPHSPEPGVPVDVASVVESP